MESFGKVQEESIQKIENLFHVVLPEDYTKFLLDFNGGVIFNTEPGEVYLKDIAQFINIDVLYGIDTGKSECDIEYWTDKYFDELLENTIIIGDSLQHGFIVMICAGENEVSIIMMIRIILKNQMMKEMYTGLQRTLKNFGRC